MRLLCHLLLFMLCAAPALAQDSNPDQNKPVEVTADKSLEWHRAKNQYIAKGNAVVKQAGTVIAASEITADYREGKNSGIEIYRLRASGNASIDNGGSKAVGDTLTYDVDSGVAVMTGKTLKMTSPDQTVTATERFEYAAVKGTLKAVGDATVIRPGDTLKADTITATMKNAPDGQRALERLEADGNVVIQTATETLTGAHATYTAAANSAEITGGVKITRGRSELTGERATVDLATDISSIHGARDLDPAASSPAAGDGRVRGVFYPGESGPETAPEPEPAPEKPALP